MTGSIRDAQFAFIDLLREQVSSVGKRVYPPEIQKDSLMPRITVTQLTPAEEFTGLGELSVWKVVNFVVDVWSRSPKDCEVVSDEVLDAIRVNRNWGVQEGSLDRVSTGYFYMLKVTGGSGVSFNTSLQLWQRSINVSGKWLQKPPVEGVDLT